MSKLDELRAERAKYLARAKEIADLAVTEEREFNDAERTEVMDRLERAKKLEPQIKTLEGDADIRSQIADLAAEGGETPADDTPVTDTHRQAKRRRPGGGGSLGAAFVESPEYKAMMAGFPDGRVSEKARVQSNPFRTKTLITGASDTSGGAWVLPDQTGIYDTLDRVALTVRSLISVRQTTSDTIEYVRMTSRESAAATVPEATATAGTSGTKPEGGFAFERVTTPVTTIAEWIAATRRALSDAAQLRGLIDQELRADLAEEEENQILNGDGIGENLLGLFNTPGTQVQAWDTDAFVTLRRARSKVRTGGRAIPTAYLMNPADWETVDLMRDGNEQFYGSGPFALSTPTIWGLPVVESENVAPGTAMVGDFRRAVLWDREQANITVTDSHDNFFIRNMVAILAEERVAFGVIRPSAFVEIDMTAGA